MAQRFPAKTSDEFRQLSVLRDWLRQGQQHKLGVWIQSHPEQAESLQLWLLTDALLACLHGVPTLAPDSLQVLKALAQAQPIPSLRPYTGLLDSTDFHKPLFELLQTPALDKPERGAAQALHSLLKDAWEYVWGADELPRLEPEPNSVGYTLFDRMSFTQEGALAQPDRLPLQLYLNRSFPDPEGLQQLAGLAEQHGMQAFQALVLLKQAHALEDKPAAAALLKEVQNIARTLDSPMLKFQAFLQLALLKPESANSHMAAAEALLQKLPAGALKQMAFKFWADMLLRQNRLSEARRLYFDLAETEVPWMLDGLLRTFAQTRDTEMLPLIEKLTQHPQDGIAQQALSVWVSLIPQAILPEALARLTPELSEVRQGYVLAQLPPLWEVARKLQPDIQAALRSDSLPRQLGALHFLEQQATSMPMPADFSFLQEALELLHSPDSEVQLSALAFLSGRQQFETASLELLKRGDIAIRRQVLWLLQPVAKAIPLDALYPWLHAEDNALRLNALALLVLQGKAEHMDDFVTLWREERFSQRGGGEHALAEALQKEQISWEDWRQALEKLLRSETATHDLIACQLIASLDWVDPLPNQALVQLDTLLQHPSYWIRAEAIQRLRTAPRSPERSWRIAEFAEQTSDAYLRAHALNYLADSPDQALNTLFHTALSDPSEDVREAAGRFWAQASPAELEARLAQAEHLSDTEVLGLVESLSSTQHSSELGLRLRFLYSTRSLTFRNALVSQLLSSGRQWLDPGMLNGLITGDVPDPELIRFLRHKPVWLQAAALQRLLASEDPRSRASGLVLAQAKGDVGFFDAVLPLFSDESTVPLEWLEALDFSFYPRIKGTISIRLLAFHVLHTLDDARAKVLLPAALRAPQANLRRYAVERLSGIHADLPSDQLQPLLEDADAGVRFAALQILDRQRARTGEALEPTRWIPFLHMPEFRTWAALILKRHPHLDARLLAPLLQDANSETREIAQSLSASLTQHLQPGELPHLLNKLRHNPHLVFVWKRKGLPAGVSWEQIYAGVLAMLKALPPQASGADSLAGVLIRIKQAEAIPDLLKLLDSQPLSSYTLQFDSTPEQIPLFAALLERGQTAYQWTVAIDLLDHHKASGFVAQVLPYITHADTALQSSAIRYVGHYGNETERALLLPLLKSKPLPDGLYQALAAHPHLPSFGQIIALLEQPESERRDVAVDVAGAWKIRAAVPVLMRLFEEYAATDKSLSYAILAALGQIGDPVAIPFLREKLTQQVLQKVIIESLYALGDSDTARLALMRYLEQADSDERVAALERLEKIQDKALVPYLMDLLPSRETGRSYAAEGSRQIGALACDLLRTLADPEHVPEMIRRLPHLPADRQSDVEYALFVITERQPVWPTVVLEEIQGLLSHSDGVVRQAAEGLLGDLQD